MSKKKKGELIACPLRIPIARLVSWLVLHISMTNLKGFEVNVRNVSTKIIHNKLNQGKNIPIASKMVLSVMLDNFYIFLEFKKSRLHL